MTRGYSAVQLPTQIKTFALSHGYEMTTQISGTALFERGNWDDGD